MNERLLVIGATSAIATGVARRYAANTGTPLTVVEGAGHWAIAERPGEVAAALKADGLVGIEVDHQDHDEPTREELRSMAPAFRPGWDILIIARPPIVEADQDTLAGALRGVGTLLACKAPPAAGPADNVPAVTAPLAAAAGLWAAMAGPGKGAPLQPAPPFTEARKACLPSMVSK